MPGALWVMLLITMAGLLLGHAAGLDEPTPPKPKVKQWQGRYWIWHNGHNYGPFLTMNSARTAAVQLRNQQMRGTGR